MRKIVFQLKERVVTFSITALFKSTSDDGINSARRSQDLLKQLLFFRTESRGNGLDINWNIPFS